MLQWIRRELWLIGGNRPVALPQRESLTIRWLRRSCKLPGQPQMSIHAASCKSC